MLLPGGPCRCSPPPALLRSPLPLSSVSPPSAVRTRSRAASSSAWWEKVPRGARWRWRGCRLASTVATRRRRLGRAVRCLAGRRTPPPSRSRRRCACKRCPVAATAVGKRGGGGGVGGWQAPRYGPFFGECDGAATRRRDGQGSSPRSMARGSRRRCASRCELSPRAVASCPSA